MAIPPNERAGFDWAMQYPGLVRPLAVDQAEIARRRAAAPLKPAKPQQACDVGLFSDVATQTDLVDLVRKS